MEPVEKDVEIAMEDAKINSNQASPARESAGAKCASSNGGMQGINFEPREETDLKLLAQSDLEPQELATVCKEEQTTKPVFSLPEVFPSLESELDTEIENNVKLERCDSRNESEDEEYNSDIDYEMITDENSMIMLQGLCHGCYRRALKINDLTVKYNDLALDHNVKQQTISLITAEKDNAEEKVSNVQEKNSRLEYIYNECQQRLAKALEQNRDIRNEHAVLLNSNIQLNKQLKDFKTQMDQHFQKLYAFNVNCVAAFKFIIEEKCKIDEVFQQFMLPEAAPLPPEIVALSPLHQTIGKSDKTLLKSSYPISTDTESDFSATDENDDYVPESNTSESEADGDDVAGTSTYKVKKSHITACKLSRALRSVRRQQNLNVSTSMESGVYQVPQHNKAVTFDLSVDSTDIENHAKEAGKSDMASRSGIFDKENNQKAANDINHKTETSIDLTNDFQDAETSKNLQGSLAEKHQSSNENLTTGKVKIDPNYKNITPDFIETLMREHYGKRNDRTFCFNIQIRLFTADEVKGKVAIGTGGKAGLDSGKRAYLKDLIYRKAVAEGASKEDAEARSTVTIINKWLNSWLYNLKSKEKKDVAEDAGSTKRKPKESRIHKKNKKFRQ